MNVSINGQASFTCTVKNVFDILWEFNMSVTIDEVQLQHHIILQSNGDQLTYTLKMEINEDQDIALLNNSIITCRGYKLMDSGTWEVTDYSYPPALLLIQGQ